MSQEKIFQIPVILSIPATSYDEAVRQADEVVDEMIMMDSGIGMVVFDKCDHDTSGQRVIHLHPENNPPE